jgi:hypothetical protein
MEGAYVDVRPLEEYIPPEDDASVIIPSAPEFIAGQLIQIEPVSE